MFKKNLYYFSMLNTALNRNSQHTFVSLVGMAPPLPEQAYDSHSVVTNHSVNEGGEGCEEGLLRPFGANSPKHNVTFKINYKN